MTQQDQTQPVDPSQVFAHEYEGITTTDTVAHTVWQLVTTYKVTGAKERIIARSGIVSSPSTILAPLALTARAIGAESVADVFGTDSAPAIARAIARAIDDEMTAEHSAAELEHYHAIIGDAYVTMRETRDRVTYTQKPVDVMKWAADTFGPLFTADADAYLMRRATTTDGKRRVVKTAPVPYAQNQTRASWSSQRQHVGRRAARRVRAAEHRMSTQLAAARSAEQSGNARAALAAAQQVADAVESVSAIVPRATYAEQVTAAAAIATAARAALAARS